MSLLNFFYRYYDMHFKQKLFNKVLMIYFSIIIISVLGLALVIYYNYAESTIENKLGESRNVQDNVRGYMESKHVASQRIVYELYRDGSLLRDLLDFLRLDFSTYYHHRLERYIQSTSFESKNIEQYFQFVLADNQDIHNISLYSYNLGFLYTFAGNRYQGYIEDSSEDGSQWMTGSFHTNSVFDASLPLTFLANLRDDRMFSYAVDLNDPLTLRRQGRIIIEYNDEGILKLLNNQQSSFKGDVLLMNLEGKVLFDSSRQYKGQQYPYFEDLMMSKRIVQLDEPSYVQHTLSNELGVIIANITPISEMQRELEGLKRSITVIALVCIITSMVVTYLLIINFSRRTQTIVRAMKKLQDGDWSVRIPVQKKDELFHIANHFNLMSSQLKENIDKEYISKLKQQQAELIALQNQINPHFLFNTLEVVRMKALMEGNPQVGEMIYILSSLFKNTFRWMTIIKIHEELENCELYLKLFQIRYKNRFQYSIHMDQSIKDCEIMKFCLQPIIENYFIHGFIQQNDQNRIDIRVFCVGEEISLIITDNGTGITSERLEQIRLGLLQPRINETASIGLSNVNERIKIMHGNQYGLKVESVLHEGTSVTLKIPFRKEIVTSV